MYRRYTLGEIKRKITYVLQSNNTGLSGAEIAKKTGINRMTITKYLDILSTIGLINKKKVGSVNLWSLESGVIDLEFPANFTEVQQKFLNAVLQGNENQSRAILINIVNSNADQVKLLTDVLLPTVNTINELYNRGRLGKTERISFLNSISELLDLLKFSMQTTENKVNAQTIAVAGSEDRIYHGKCGAIALQILGWSSSYIGSVEQHLDPFFDIDFQRYIVKVWNKRNGLMLICIHSSAEVSLRFLLAAAKPIKEKFRGRVEVILITSPELELLLRDVGADFVTSDMQSMIKWAEQEFKKFAISGYA
ncbi:MAG TPA: HTH domain-containing protein [Nitrososphaeraceae archaeon]|nr:HTH domain-containing protein [Nitrososphaeraceae archaeon]